MEHTNGGIQRLVESVHTKGNYRLPLKNMAYIIYNMSLKEMYDPDLISKFEEGYKTVSATHMNARIAYGALSASYSNNQASQFGIDFWESKLEDNIEGMHA
jgi:hypothetical protein